MHYLKNYQLWGGIAFFLFATWNLLTIIQINIQAVHEFYKDDYELMMKIKQLIREQQYDTNISDTGKAIILRQSIINVFETGNLSHFFPIPLNERNRTVIFSSWRSGSTFIGDIFNNLPANYYDYEPFDAYGVVQMKPNLENATFIRDLLSCNFSSHAAHAHIIKENHWEFNKHIAGYCRKTEEEKLCKNSSFREEFCHIFPRLNMKLVRARVSISERLLADSNLNVNVILQVRDPRGVHHSRKTFETCYRGPDCYDMKRYCQYLVEDYLSAKELRKTYPKRFKVLRFEELALEPFKVTREIFDQFKIEFDENIQTFLESHTTTTKGNHYSTYRDSKSVIREWLTNINMTEITQIQTDCELAMHLWGYKMFKEEDKLKADTFIPINDYSF